jgi:hypothetical protein
VPICQKRDSSESSEDDDKDGNDKNHNGKKSQSQWVAVIEQQNSCDTHQGQACVVLPSGDHHTLTHADKSLWGMLMVRDILLYYLHIVIMLHQTQGHPSTTEPPAQLIPKAKGPDSKVTVRSTKNKSQPPSQAPSQLPDPNIPPVPVSYPIVPSTHPVAPPYFNPQVVSSGFYHPYYGHMAFPAIGGPTSTPARYNRTAHPQNPQFTPGSESVDEIDEDVTLFPQVAMWLQGLDADERRGHDGHNFAQYAAKLEAQMFVRILHVEKLSKEELISICDMPIGTASMICAYAQKDCNKIRKAALQNLRERRLELKRYN